MPRIIYKELRENMSSFKTKTIALIASSLIVAVAGLSFATTPAFAQKKAGGYPLTATNKSTTAKAAQPKNSGNIAVAPKQAKKIPPNLRQRS